MNILISIIIPTHNRRKLLSALIDSIPVHPNIEVLVVDDQSTEDLSSLPLDKFSWGGLIINESGKRFAGSARNVGIMAARGEYLFFADSDDLIIKKGFLQCMEYLRGSSLDILFVKTSSFLHNTSLIGDRHLKFNWLLKRVINGDPKEILSRFEVPWSKFIRREYILKHGIFFEEIRYSNDIEFSALLVLKGGDIEIKEYLVYSVRQGNDSLTSTNTIESCIVRLNALNRYNRLLRSNNLSYLTAPSLYLLLRLARLDFVLGLRWLLKTILSGNPVLLKKWTLTNVIRRKLNLFFNGKEWLN